MTFAAFKTPRPCLLNRYERSRARRPTEDTRVRLQDARFDHFQLFGSDGPEFERLAPVLAERIYSKNIRVLMNGLSQIEQGEVEKILRLAENAPPSFREES